MPAKADPRLQRGLTAAHSRAVSAVAVHKADRRPEVAEVRDRYLDGKLIEPSSVPSWIESQIEKGELAEWVTTGPDGREEPERRPIDYYEPGDEYIRSIPSTVELELLRQVANRLASDYNWRPAQATVYLLAGVAPQVPSMRSTVRHSSSGSKIILEIDAEQDPQPVTRAYSSARQRRGDSGNRMTERKAELAAFMVDHLDGEGKPEGTWDDLRIQWWQLCRANPAWRYGDRRSFSSAARDALERVGIPLRSELGP